MKDSSKNNKDKGCSISWKQQALTFKYFQILNVMNIHTGICIYETGSTPQNRTIYFQIGTA